MTILKNDNIEKYLWGRKVWCMWSYPNNDNVLPALSALIFTNHSVNGILHLFGSHVNITVFTHSDAVENSVLCSVTSKLECAWLVEGNK